VSPAPRIPRHYFLLFSSDNDAVDEGNYYEDINSALDLQEKMETKTSSSPSHPLELPTDVSSTVDKNIAAGEVNLFNSYPDDELTGVGEESITEMEGRIESNNDEGRNSGTEKPIMEEEIRDHSKTDNALEDDSSPKKTITSEVVPETGVIIHESNPQEDEEEENIERIKSADLLNFPQVCMHILEI